jgi:alkanesulfonate monooxygenase SsuD/methylene tetrahydromethanopterin reductase-like flavin-dependent oxidoreductase (luciferase family)
LACAAAAGRTRHLRFRPILLTPFYDPLRLAEDIAVVDLLSGGRIEPLLAAGYRPVEFAMFGRLLEERRRLVDDALDVLKQAWTGEPFDYQGRSVRVTPRPLQTPHPPIYLGGSFASIARRAAHVADGFYPGEPRLWDDYRSECLTLGRDPGPSPAAGPTFFYVTDDPDRAWGEVGPYLMHSTNTYAAWAREAFGHSLEHYPPIDDVAQLRASGAYHLLTPEDAVAYLLGLGPDAVLILRPLFGGLDPDLALRSLDLFDQKVRPYLGSAA